MALLNRKLPGMSGVLQDPEIKKIKNRLPAKSTAELEQLNKELKSSEQKRTRLLGIVRALIDSRY